MEILKPIGPCDIQSFKKVGSKKIIEEFLQRGLDDAEIDVTSTHRRVESVYTSLLVYLQRHSEHGVRVRFQDGKIYLHRVTR